MGCPLTFLQLLGVFKWGAAKIILKVLGVCGITWEVLVGFRGFRGGDYAAPPPLQPLVGVGCSKG